ncbi:MAG: hypothetical protein KatS3mg102_1030 [Planctomycetota bacterium]|nr:MAG: hypothetical protein KatS3mg102_1030 [Planctomycetota bacterium]
MAGAATAVVLAVLGLQPGELIEYIVYVIFFLVMAFGGWIKQRAEASQQRRRTATPAPGGEPSRAPEQAAPAPQDERAEEVVQRAEKALRRLLGLPEAPAGEAPAPASAPGAEHQSPAAAAPVGAPPPAARDPASAAHRRRPQLAAHRPRRRPRAELAPSPPAPSAPPPAPASAPPHGAQAPPAPIGPSRTSTAASRSARELLPAAVAARLSPAQRLFVGSVVFARPDPRLPPWRRGR